MRKFILHLLLFIFRAFLDFLCLKRAYEKWFIVLFILTMLGMIFSILMAFHLLKKLLFLVFLIPKNNDTHELLVIFYER